MRNFEAFEYIFTTIISSKRTYELIHIRLNYASIPWLFRTMLLREN